MFHVFCIFVLQTFLRSLFSAGQREDPLRIFQIFPRDNPNCKCVDYPTDRPYLDRYARVTENDYILHSENNFNATAMTCIA